MPRETTERDARRALPVVGLLVLVAIAFAPVLGNGFVNWDDTENLLENPHFRGLGPSQLRWAWTTFWIGVYQPLGWMLFELESVLFGLRPWGYHLTSVIVHAAVVVAVYGLARRVDGASRPPATFLGVALFAVHPLRVEAVAWASCQPYLPCALFAVLAAWAYVRAYQPGGGAAWRWAALALFVASLLAHATAVGLPLVLLALDHWPLKRLLDARSAWRAVVEKWPFCVVATGFAVVGYLAKRASGSMVDERLESTLRLALAGEPVFFYIAKSLVPAGLQVHYPIARGVTARDPAVVLSTLGVLAVSAGAVLLRKRWPGLLTAWVCYLVLLAPNSGLVSFGSQRLADRYSYLASIVGACAASYGLSRVPEGWSRQVFAAVAATVAALVVLTWLQCLTWKDSETLWARSLRLGGGNDPIARNNMGAVCYRQGLYTEALVHLNESLRLDPDVARNHFNLGTVLLDLGRYPEAIARLEAAVRLDPDHADARENLAMALTRAGRTREATAQLRMVVRLRPDRVKARQRLGRLLTDQGHFAEARTQLSIAVRQAPDDLEGRLALGRVLAELGRLDEAVDQLGAAVKLRPDSADARFNLGLILAASGRADEARSQFREVLRLRPDDPGARRALERLER
jgi:tetratricopeptide (TPR) repeat protein